MHGFLLSLGSHSTEQTALHARRALLETQRVLPDISAEPQIRVQELPSLQATLAYVTPRRDYTPPLISIHQAAEGTTFCYGKLDEPGDPAAAMHRAFAEGGLDAAHELSGCFAALVLDAQQGRITAFTDLIGMRGFRYAERAGQIWIASHDLFLVAAGAVDGSFDLDSIASTVSCDWSLGGKSFLNNVHCFSAAEFATWQAGAFKVTRHSKRKSPRLEQGDRAGIVRQLDQIASSLEQGAAKLAQTQAKLACSLTAGKDSRLVLALLRAANANFEVQTAGAETSRDVRVARQLARLVGVKHTTVPIPETTADAFEGMTKLLSFSMNGMTNAKRALGHLPRFDPERRILAGGVGGGIFAGAFYHYYHAAKTTPSTPEAAAQLLARWRFRRLTSLNFSDPACAERVHERLQAALHALSLDYQDPWDLLDAFYLFERYARWAAYGELNAWTRRWTPFENCDAIRQAQRLPAPIGAYCTLQPLLVRRHLPLGAYLTKVNDESFLFLQGGTTARDVTRRVVRRLLKTKDRLRRHSRSPADQSSEVLRANLFKTTLRSYLEDTLCEGPSLSLDLFGKTATRRLIERHVEAGDQLQPLGFLVTANVFRQQVAALASPASAVGV